MPADAVIGWLKGEYDMERREFLNTDGSINMQRALEAGRRARAEAAKIGAGEVVRLFKPRQHTVGFLKVFF